MKYTQIQWRKRHDCYLQLDTVNLQTLSCPVDEDSVVPLVHHPAPGRTVFFFFLKKGLAKTRVSENTVHPLVMGDEVAASHRLSDQKPQ